MEFKTEELTILEKVGVSSRYADTFVYEPAIFSEITLGNLYIVGEVISVRSRSQNAQFLNELVSTVKNEYYRASDKLPLGALKLALKKANVFVRKSNLTRELSELKMVIATLSQNTIHLSHSGGGVVLLLRNGELETIFPTQREFYLAGQNDKKYFSAAFENIVSGRVAKEDIILLTTSSIYKLPEKEIIRCLAAENSTKKFMASRGVFKSLAAVILKPSLAAPASPKLQPASRRGEPAAGRGQAPAPLQAKAVTPHQTNIYRTDTPTALIKKLWSWPRPLRQSFSPPRGQAGTASPRLAAGGPRQGNRKILWAIILAAVAVGLITFSALSIKKETLLKKREAEKLITEIEALREKTISLVSLGNETEADDSLRAWQEKLERLGQLNYFKTTRASLEENFKRVSRQLKHFENISTLFPVLSLEGNSPNFDPRSLYLSKNSLTLFDRNTVYQFNLNLKQGNFVLFSEELGGDITDVIDSPGAAAYELLLLTGNRILNYSSDSGLKTLFQNQANNPISLTQFVFYNDAAYILGADGLIYKLPLIVEEPASDVATTTSGEAASALGDLTLWLNPAEKISSPIKNIAVDGFIYGLTEKDSILKLLNGQIKAEFKLEENTDHIFTSPALKDIYTLSGDEGLVVVADKFGSVKKRLYHPSLRGAKSFFVNPQGKTVYILKGKTVLSFEL